MLEKWELEVLERYKKGDIVKEEDRKTVDSLSSIGLMNLGFTIDEDKDEPRGTAQLTPIGLQELTEYRQKKSWKKTFGDIFHAIMT